MITSGRLGWSTVSLSYQLSHCNQQVDNTINHPLTCQHPAADCTRWNSWQTHLQCNIRACETMGFTSSLSLSVSMFHASSPDRSTLLMSGQNISTSQLAYLITYSQQHIIAHITCNCNWTITITKTQFQVTASQKQVCTGLTGLSTARGVIQDTKINHCTSFKCIN